MRDQRIVDEREESQRIAKKVGRHRASLWGMVASGVVTLCIGASVEVRLPGLEIVGWIQCAGGLIGILNIAASEERERAFIRREARAGFLLPITRGPLYDLVARAAADTGVAIPRVFVHARSRAHASVVQDEAANPVLIFPLAFLSLVAERPSVARVVAYHEIAHIKHDDVKLWAVTYALQSKVFGVLIPGHLLLMLIIALTGRPSLIANIWISGVWSIFSGLRLASTIQAARRRAEFRADAHAVEHCGEASVVETLFRLASDRPDSSLGPTKRERLLAVPSGVALALTTEALHATQRYPMQRGTLRGFLDSIGDLDPSLRIFAREPWCLDSVAIALFVPKEAFTTSLLEYRFFLGVDELQLLVRALRRDGLSHSAAATEVVELVSGRAARQ